MKTNTENTVSVVAIVKAYDTAVNARKALSQAFADLYNGLLASCDRDAKEIKAGMKQAGLAFMEAKQGVFETPLLLGALALAGIDGDYCSAFFNGMVDKDGNRFVSRARVSQVMSELGIETSHGSAVKESGKAGKSTAPVKTAAEKEFERIQSMDAVERKALIAMMKKAGLL